MRPFDPPDDLRTVLETPGRVWTDAQYRRVLEWLEEPPQHGFLVGFIRRLLGETASVEDAEDLVSDFLLRALVGRRFANVYDPSAAPAQLPAHRAFAAFVRSDLRRFALRRWRRAERHREVPLERMPEVPLDPANPESLFALAEARKLVALQAQELVAVTWDRLSAPEQRILERHLFAGIPFDQIAAEEEIHTSTARTRYYRVIHKLRRLAGAHAPWGASGVDRYYPEASFRSTMGWLRWRDRLLLARSWIGAARSAPPDGDAIACTVFGPRAVVRKERCLIQVYAHLFDQEAEALRLALEFDEAAGRLGVKSLELPVNAGTQLTFDLALPGLEIDDPIQSLTWRRRTEAVSFGVDIPSDCRLGAFIGTVTVSANGIPAGRIKFRLTVASGPHPSGEPLRPKGEEARRFTLAFISYASEDRNKVLARVQMLRLLDIDYFQDVLTLDPGQRWERELYRHIDECDLFLLFWSKAASASEWVLKEIRYAVRRKGDNDDAPPAIHPVIIEGPPIVSPPPELQHLHFNDRLVYFMSPDLPSA